MSKELQLHLRLAWHCEYRGAVSGCDARAASGDAANRLRRSRVEMDNEEYVTHKPPNKRMVKG